MRILLLFVAGSLALCAAPGAFANRVPFNELANGDFEQGEAFWRHFGNELAIGPADGHGDAVYCKYPDGDLLLRQVVDEKQFPGWDPDLNAKLIDLSAWVLCEDLSDGPTSAVEFQIDWWYTQGDDPPQDPADGWSGWVTINFAQIPRYQPSKWLQVFPFEWNTTLFADFQPRWISVECRLIQGAGETVWVDDFELYGKCIPEPSMLATLLTGLSGLVGARLIRRKYS